MSGDITERRQNGTSFWVAGFPTPTGADFSFRVYVYEDGDACLSSHRGAPDYFIQYRSFCCGPCSVSFAG
jgi:hypothetical protein